MKGFEVERGIFHSKRGRGKRKGRVEKRKKKERT